MTTRVAMPPISEEDLKWVLELRRQIWMECAPDQFGHRACWDSRELTEEEWERVKAILARYELPIELSSDGLGHLCIVVYQHPEVPGVPAEAWLGLRMDHLPGIKKQRGYENSFPYGWKRFSPFTHSERNRQLLALYGLDPVKDRGHYVC